MAAKKPAAYPKDADHSFIGHIVHGRPITQELSRSRDAMLEW
jgi:hypothetical protein